MLTSLLSRWKPYIVNLKIQGPVTPQTTAALNSSLDRIIAHRPKMIGLSINSLRGSLVQAENISGILTKLTVELQCPLYTFAEDAALSSAFALLLTGKKTFADPHALVGGAGFSLQTIGLEAFTQHFLLEPVLLASGEHKMRLSPFAPLDAGDEEWVRALLRQREQELKSFIVRTRADLEGRVPESVFTGRKAVESGLVGAIGDIYSTAHSEFPGSTVVEVQLSQRHRRLSESSSLLEVKQELESSCKSSFDSLVFNRLLKS